MKKLRFMFATAVLLLFTVVLLAATPQPATGGPKDKIIPIGDEVEFGRHMTSEKYLGLQGDSLFIYNRKDQSLTKMELNYLTLLNSKTVLNSIFFGEALYCIANDPIPPSTNTFQKLDLKTKKFEKIQIDNDVLSAYDKKRWAVEHGGSMEGYKPSEKPDLESRIVRFFSYSNKLYIGIQDTGILEYDPATGKSRLFFMLASKKTGGGSGFDLGLPLPPPFFVPMNGRLFALSIRGPIFLDPATGKWALLACKQPAEEPEWGKELDASDGAVYPMGMSFEDYMAIYVITFFGSLGQPLEKGRIFYDTGLFLSNGAMRVSLPWQPAFLSEDSAEDLGMTFLTYRNEVWGTKHAECEEETKNHLVLSTDAGASWKHCTLQELSREGITCSMVDVADDSVVLLVQDAAKPKGDYLLIRPKSALSWKPLPKAPCNGVQQIENEGEGEAGIQWKTKTLWTKAPDPNAKAPASRPPASKQK